MIVYRQVLSLENKKSTQLGIEKDKRNKNDQIKRMPR